MLLIISLPDMTLPLRHAFATRCRCRHFLPLFATPAFSVTPSRRHAADTRYHASFLARLSAPATVPTSFTLSSPLSAAMMLPPPAAAAFRRRAFIDMLLRCHCATLVATPCHCIYAHRFMPIIFVSLLYDSLIFLPLRARFLFWLCACCSWSPCSRLRLCRDIRYVASLFRARPAVLPPISVLFFISCVRACVI